MKVKSSVKVVQDQGTTMHGHKYIVMQLKNRVEPRVGTLISEYEVQALISNGVDVTVGEFRR